MNILITNDDGIDCEGIIRLAKKLSEKHRILVLAPATNMTASGHSLTIGKSLFLKKCDIGEGIRAYSLTGTPADCVKFADSDIIDFIFDVVVSGINKGSNLGSDVVYSGTLSAALEGVLLGYPSIAFSSCADFDNDFEGAASTASYLLDNVLDITCKGIAWNVNIPGKPKEDMRGVRFTQTGIQIYSDLYRKVSEGEYILGGYPLEHDKNEEDCDVEWMKKNYITVTPILFNKTDYSLLDKYRPYNLDFKGEKKL